MNSFDQQTSSKPTPDVKRIHVAAIAAVGAAILSVSFYCPGLAHDVTSQLGTIFSPDGK